MPSLTRNLVVDLILAALAVAFIATVPAKSERLPIKNYTTADGLAHNAVNRIVRDSRGFLWFCTFEGLSRFDGYSFTTYGVDHGLPSPVIHDLLETRNGEYWVATGGGLCRFNPRGIAQPRVQNGAQQSASHMFTVYLPDGDAGSRNAMNLIETSSGAIFCGTSRGLYRLEQQNGQVTFNLIRIGLQTGLEDYFEITSIVEDRGGALWLGSGNGIIRLLADGRVERYSKARNGLPSDAIHSLLEDRDGRIWAGTQEGLCRLIPEAEPAHPIVARVYTEKDGLPTLWINQVLQASDGSLWAGSNQGLIKFIPSDGGRDFRFRAYAQPHGMISQEVGSLVEDRNGNLWVGMLNGGAAKIVRSGITAFGESDGFQFFPYSLIKTRSEEFLALVTCSDTPAKHCISQFDGERFNQLQLRVPDAVQRSWGWNQLVLEDRTGELWVGTRQGIYRFPRVDSLDRLAQTPPKAVYTTREGLASNVVVRLFEDSRGDVWISAPGQGGGLSRWERDTNTFHSYTLRDGLPLFQDSYPVSFCEDRTGAVWIGFSFTDGSNLLRYRDGRFTNFTSADGIPEGGIFNLLVDSSGRLWVPTTRGGVCFADNPEAAHPDFFTQTTANGLASNSVKCVTEDRFGRIYVGTGRGIDRLDRSTGHVRHYTTADGLPVGDPSAALQDREGALWFTFPTGFARLIPEPLTPPVSPPILITGLTVAGGVRPISALGEVEIAPVELGAGENQLQIDFVALGFSAGEGLRYQYKVEGASQDWSPPSEQRTVNFANLAPGSYHFFVRAVNADGVISETPASFSFRVLPPIWQRWWFLALATLMIGFAAYALYRYRVARLLELERVRTRIASDLHDDIGANLTRIAILSEVANAQLQDDNPLIQSPLSSIAQISRESVASMGDIVWAINPKRDHLIDLVQRMRRLTSEVFAGRKIEYEFLAPEMDADHPLGADVRRDLLLIFKEAINNVARHSICSNAKIELRIERAAILLIVRDDGRGFNIENSTEGNGLLSMQRRAASLGAELRLTTIQGEGTEIILKVPR